jgi:hypothetical protein
MDSLLTWDFSHGSKVAHQVRRRFQTSVHLQAGISAPGFFLVAEFVDSSFDLNVQNVALALESCIGGFADHLQVQWLYDRCFKFRLASNRVGHFIHTLNFFKCPDFTVYFHLYRANSNTFHPIDGTDDEADWMRVSRSGSKPWPKYLRNFPTNLIGKADGFIPRSIAIKPDLSILKNNANICSSSSAIDDYKDTVFNNIKIGSFSFSEAVGRNSNFIQLPLQFGKNSVKRSAYSHEDFSLDSILDLIHAGYSPSDLVSYVQIFKSACTNCFTLGHRSNQCTNGIRCLGCLRLGHAKRDCDSPFILGDNICHTYSTSVSKDCTFGDKARAAKVVTNSVRLTSKPRQIWIKKKYDEYCIRCLAAGLSSHGCFGTPRCIFAQDMDTPLQVANLLRKNLN